VFAPASSDELVERSDIEVPLERIHARQVASLGGDQVDRLGTGELDVGPCRVEVGVARHDLSGAPITEKRIRSAARP